MKNDARLKELRGDIAKQVAEYYRLAHDPAAEEFVPGKTRIRYAGRVFDEREMIDLVDSSLDFWLTAGRFSRAFERKLKAFYGVADVILVNSGSSANLLAVSALTSPTLGKKQLLPGDEVISVAAGFPSTVAPILQNGLVPVFLDVDLESYNIDVTRLADAVSEKTKAIFVAHTLGNPFDLDAVLAFARKNDLWVIEDNCDALGSRYRGQLTGTFGHMATGSFYPAHHITTGEGGCVVTDDPQLSLLVRSFRDWGRDCYCKGGKSNTCGTRFSRQYGDLPPGYDHKYVYSHIGYNLKMTDMQAAIGSAQMDKLELFTEKRKANFRLMWDGLANFQDAFILPKATEHADPSWFSFILTLQPSASFSRLELAQFLEGRRIETRGLFAGNILKQPGYMKTPHRVIGSLEQTDYIMNNTLFLGVYPGMTRDMITYTLETLHEFVDQH